MWRSAVLALGASLIVSVPAFAANPCEGQAPPAGATLTGTVIHVIDGQHLCVATGPTPDRWVAVTLADAAQVAKASNGASPRNLLMAASFSQPVECQIIDDAKSAPAAVCKLGGVSIARRAADPLIVRAASAWR